MILAILQARASSTRLPGKVLKPILGVPMILRQIERIHQVEKIDTLIVATSTDETDDELANLCAINNVQCFRGSLQDVLDRFYQAAKASSPEYVIRLTADCPLIEPKLIDKVIAYHCNHGFDITGADMTKYPDGLDIDIFNFSSLEKTWKEATLPSEREHVVTYMWSHPERFKHGKVGADFELAHLRWTVDEALDFEFVSAVYEELYHQKKNFDMYDILAYLDKKPELKSMNAIYKRNAGYEKSLLKDKEYLDGNI